MALFGKWDVTLQPSTCLTKAHTLLKLRPALKSALTGEILEGWEVEKAVVGPRRALSISVADLIGVLRKCPRLERYTILFLWVGALRHGDLRTATITRMTDQVVRVQWSVQKSDRLGRRFLTKFVIFPFAVGPPWANYRETYETVKAQNIQLTVHSLRRGALTHLADKGYSHAEIATFSLHAPTSDAHLAVRRYVDPSPSQPEGGLQLQMSLTLLRALGL